MRLRERLRDLGKSPAEHQADALRAQSDLAGGDDLTTLEPRRAAVVCGTIRTVTLPPRRNVPVLVAELWDGDGSVNLVWIGRRRIAGIEPGVFLRARGRVALSRGLPTIFNPAYEIVPQQ